MRLRNAGFTYDPTQNADAARSERTNFEIRPWAEKRLGVSMKKKRVTKRDLAERVEALIRHRTANTWGEIEALAGVTDRMAFWHDRTEGQARADLRTMIGDRLMKGELS